MITPEVPGSIVTEMFEALESVVVWTIGGIAGIILAVVSAIGIRFILRIRAL